MALVEDFLRVLVDTDCEIAKTMFNTWIARKSTTDRDNWRIFLETPITNSWLAEFRGKTHTGLQKGLKVYRKSGTYSEEGDGEFVREICMFMTEFDTKAKPFFAAIPKPPPVKAPLAKVTLPAEYFPQAEEVKPKEKIVAVKKVKRVRSYCPSELPQPPPPTKNAMILGVGTYPEVIHMVLSQLGYHTPPYTHKISDDGIADPEEFASEVLSLMKDMGMERVLLSPGTRSQFDLAKQVWGSLNRSPRFLTDDLRFGRFAYLAWKIKEGE